MRLLILLLSSLFTLSACSQTEPRPDGRIPPELLAPVPQPRMHGTTNGDLWRLIARQKAGIATGNSKLAAIACIDQARAAIIAGDPPPTCAAPDPGL